MIYCEERRLGKWVPVTYGGEGLPDKVTGTIPPQRRNVKLVQTTLQHLTLDQLREIYG